MASAAQEKKRHDRGKRACLYPGCLGCQPGRVRPTIRYTSTPAGRIAYSTSGSGPALLCDSGWVTHLRRQLELFSFGPFVAGLADHFTVIRYDKPGCGLSDRDGIDLSFDAQVAAALAVADAAGAGRFSSVRPRAASSPPRSARGTRIWSTRSWCTGCARPARTWPRRRSGTRSWP